MLNDGNGKKNGDKDDKANDAMITADKIRKTRAKAKQSKRELAPSSDDPRVELRRLVREHWKRTRGSVALQSMGSAKKAHKDMPDRGLKKGDVIPCAYPDDIAREMREMATAMSKTAEALEPSIKAQLKLCPIWRDFLSKVYGVGPIVAAYLISEIDIGHTDETGRQLRPSGFRRYCGYAVIEGKLERPTKGVKLGYNAELRKRIWQAFQAMRKNSAKCTNDAPYGITNKYLQIWYDAKVGALAAGMKPGHADSKGRNKATDVFLLDLYTVWRAIEGLPVFPSYYERKLGEGHRGWKLLNQDDPGRMTGDDSKLLTPDAAMVLVGDISPVPLQASRKWTIDSGVGDE